MPVRIIRTETLLEKTLKIVLRLQENEHFKCYLETYKNTNLYTAKGEQISGVRYVFTFNEMYTQPNFWKNYAEQGLFWRMDGKEVSGGESSVRLTPIDWQYANSYGYKMQSARLPFFARTVRIYLQEQADAGNPVTDSDGKYMQLARTTRWIILIINNCLKNCQYENKKCNITLVHSLFDVVL